MLIKKIDKGHSESFQENQHNIFGKDGELLKKKRNWKKTIITLVVSASIGTGILATWYFVLGGNSYNSLKRTAHQIYDAVLVQKESGDPEWTKNLKWVEDNKDMFKEKESASDPDPFRIAKWTIETNAHKNNNYSQNTVIEAYQKISKTDYWIAITDKNWDINGGNYTDTKWGTFLAHIKEINGKNMVINMTDVYAGGQATMSLDINQLLDKDDSTSDDSLDQTNSMIAFFTSLLIFGGATYYLMRNASNLFLEKRWYTYTSLTFIVMVGILFGFFFIPGPLWIFSTIAGISFGTYGSWLISAYKLRKKILEEKFKGGPSY